jgi:molybdopterin synthase catalytic subunit
VEKMEETRNLYEIMIVKRLVKITTGVQFRRNRILRLILLRRWDSVKLVETCVMIVAASYNRIVLSRLSYY